MNMQQHEQSKHGHSPATALLAPVIFVAILFTVLAIASNLG